MRSPLSSMKTKDVQDRRETLPTVPYAPGSRKVYNMQFKLNVVCYAMQRPESNRIKPTARRFPGVEPVSG